MQAQKMMELSWRILTLMVALLTCTEEFCKGNETNGAEGLKEVAREPVDTTPLLSKYMYNYMYMFM